MKSEEIQQSPFAVHDETGPEKPTLAGYTGDHVTGTRTKTTAEKSLLLKCRTVIIPLAAVMYFSAYLDRHSIGNAAIMGLKSDLNLSESQYADVASMFYVGYIVCMLPANVLQRKISPHYMVGTSCVLFGMFVALMSLASNVGILLALRILTGFAQAFIQGLSVYMSLWFRRDEIATVSAVIYSAATISGAFGSLIAYGIMVNPIFQDSGRPAWHYLCIIEGVVAVFAGLLFYVFLPRFPDRLQAMGKKHWLFTKEEIDTACERTSSFNTMGSKIEPRQILTALTDLKSWGFAILNGGIAAGIATIGVFLPTFVHAFGYSLVRAQLFSVIPYAVAFVCLLVVNFASDRFNKKGYPLVICLSLALVGLIILMTEVRVEVKIFGTCLLASGVYPSVTLLVAWSASNVGGFTKRATTWAMAEILGQCFSIMASRIYDTPPYYFKGHGVLLALLAVAIVDVLLLMWWMKRENVRKEKELKEYEERGEVHPHEGKTLEEVHDWHVNFRFII